MRKKCADQVLAYGEVTNHSHKVKVEVFEEGDSKFFMGPTMLIHEEHLPILIPFGIWQSGIIREWDPFEEEARYVAD
jgi:hypothetical protein